MRRQLYRTSSENATKPAHARHTYPLSSSLTPPVLGFRDRDATAERSAAIVCVPATALGAQHSSPPRILATCRRLIWHVGGAALHLVAAHSARRGRSAATGGTKGAHQAAQSSFPGHPFDEAPPALLRVVRSITATSVRLACMRSWRGPARAVWGPAGGVVEDSSSRTRLALFSATFSASACWSAGACRPTAPSGR